MPRRTPVYRGVSTAELYARFEHVEGRLAEVRDEVSSLFALILENRERLSDLEETQAAARRGSRRSRRRRRKSR